MTPPVAVHTSLTQKEKPKRPPIVRLAHNTVALTRTFDLGRPSSHPPHTSQHTWTWTWTWTSWTWTWTWTCLFFCKFLHTYVSRVVSRLQVQLDASPAAARARAQEHRRTAGPHARLPRERTRKHNSPCVYKKVVNCVSLVSPRRLASASPPSGGRPRLVADHTHNEPCTKIARAGTCSFLPISQ